MAKKKLKSTTTNDAAAPLKALIEDHSLFFDNLVKIIPSRFYLSSPDANPDEEKPWYQGLSKIAKASAKRQSRRNLKESRRQRFNPDTASSTLDILQQKAKSNPAAAAAAAEKPAADDHTVTYEELRERLHQRIRDLRSKRNTREPIDDDDGGSRKKAETKNVGKRKRKGKEMSVVGGKNKENQVGEVEKDITFGKVKAGDEDGRRKRKKLSKFKELEKAEKLSELKKDPEKAEKVSWNSAVSRAMGVKVHDDPKILKESIKKDKRRQKKSVEKWKERVQSTETKKRERQSKRNENIKERIHQKKMRRIEKREKKLMRPGFEGRKEGYINA